MDPKEAVRLFALQFSLSSQIVQTTGCKPTLESLAAHSHIPLQKVRSVLDIQEPVSMQMPMGQESTLRLEDLMVDPAAPSTLDLVSHQQLEHALQKMLGELPKREALVLKRRFGLESEMEQTLEAIGLSLGLTRERVRQIEEQALTKLRLPRRAELLKAFLEAKPSDLQAKY